jgi:hypothetical protein
MAPTGTDGPRINKRFAPPLPHGGDGNGRDWSGTGGSADRNPPTIDPLLKKPEPLENKGLDASSQVLSATDGAEGVGFELTVGLHLLRFSRPSPTTTQLQLAQRVHVAQATVHPYPFPTPPPKRPPN